MFTTQAFPLDGGTDNGFTFTSPNWATEPPGEVFTITQDYPAHPAGSFNYPNLARLPTLAVYSLKKVKLLMLVMWKHHILRNKYYSCGSIHLNKILKRYL